jgi:hypothetical protein
MIGYARPLRDVVGQRAMIAAKVRILNIQSTRKVAKEAGISQQYVAHAAIVLQYASDQVDAVISGEIALNGESAAIERWLR